MRTRFASLTYDVCPEKETVQNLSVVFHILMLCPSWIPCSIWKLILPFQSFTGSQLKQDHCSIAWTTLWKRSILHGCIWFVIHIKSQNEKNNMSIQINVSNFVQCLKSDQNSCWINNLGDGLVTTAVLKHCITLYILLLILAVTSEYWDPLVRFVQQILT